MKATSGIAPKSCGLVHAVDWPLWLKATIVGRFLTHRQAFASSMQLSSISLGASSFLKVKDATDEGPAMDGSFDGSISQGKEAE